MFIYTEAEAETGADDRGKATAEKHLTAAEQIRSNLHRFEDSMSTTDEQPTDTRKKKEGAESSAA